jgi:hypothetical protein
MIGVLAQLCAGLPTPHTSLTEGLPAPRFAPTIGDLRSKSGGVGRPAPSRFLNGIAFNAQPVTASVDSSVA